jgi:Trk K+ transport system NAD-binding subunit
MSLDLRGLNIALQQDTHGHLHDSLDTSLLIAVHLAHADIVFAVAGSCQCAHLEL